MNPITMWGILTYLAPSIPVLFGGYVAYEYLKNPTTPPRGKGNPKV